MIVMLYTMQYFFMLGDIVDEEYPSDVGAFLILC